MFDNAYSRSRPQHDPSLCISCLFFITERSRFAGFCRPRFSSLLHTRYSHWLNARTKEGLRMARNSLVCASSRHCFPLFARSRPVPTLPDFHFALLCGGHVRRGCDVTNLADVLRGYLNFIRPRLRASFDSNRLAIGARCSRICLNAPRAVRRAGKRRRLFVLIIVSHVFALVTSRII